MSSTPAPGRRAVIASSAALGLAACGSPDPAPSAGGGSAAESSSSSSSSAGSSGTAAGSSDSALIATADVPVGSATIIKDAKVVVTQPEAGTFKAFSTVCPHEGCAISLVEKGEVVCPCHNSRFDLDGARVSGPARTGLEKVEVTVSGDQVTRA